MDAAQNPTSGVQASVPVPDSKLTLSAREIARRLSYNEPNEAPAKHMLHELAHRLDTRDVRFHEKADGLLLVNGIGKTRYATWRERALYRLFGVVPARV